VYGEKKGKHHTKNTPTPKVFQNSAGGDERGVFTSSRKTTKHEPQNNDPTYKKGKEQTRGKQKREKHRKIPKAHEKSEP